MLPRLLAGCLAHTCRTLGELAVGTPKRWHPYLLQVQASAHTLQEAAQPTPKIGPIEAQYIPGKGRGIIATQQLVPGDLVMEIPPLVCLHGQPDTMIPPDVLTEALTKRLTNHSNLTHRDLTWLSMLQGDSHQQQLPLPNLTAAPHAQPTPQITPTPRAPHTPPAPPIPPAQVPPSSNHNSNTTTPAPASQQSPTPATDHTHLNDPPRIEQLVQTNAFGEASDEATLAAVHGYEPQSCLGLWPEFSLLNNSCAPSAVHYVRQDRMVVRAAKVIEKGEEVTVSYLGREGFAPVGERRQHLEERFQFRCNCSRCEAEAQLPAGLQQKLHTTYIVAKAILEEAAHAFEDDENTVNHEGQGGHDGSSTTTAVEALHLKAVGLHDGLKRCMSELKVTAKEAETAWSSTFDLHEVLYITGNVDQGMQGSSGSCSRASSDIHSSESCTATVGEIGACSEQSSGVGELIDAQQAQEGLVRTSSLTWLTDALRILERISTGDELYVYACCKLFCDLQNQQGSGDGSYQYKVQVAERLVEEAHKVRYGADISPEELYSLIAVNMERCWLYLP